MLHVLLVEKDFFFADTIGELLREEGHTYTWVQNINRTFDALGHVKVDLIITHQKGVGLTGVDVVRKIRTDPFYKEISNIPIIVLTAEPIERQVLEADGFYLSKSFKELKMFHAALDNAVMSRQGSLAR